MATPIMPGWWNACGTNFPPWFPPWERRRSTPLRWAICKVIRRKSYTLAQLGANFPRFLAETQPDSEGEAAEWGDFLVDLATLERIYSEVFDGPGSEGQSPLTPGDLEDIPPEIWPDVKLIPVPSLRLASVSVSSPRIYHRRSP